MKRIYKSLLFVMVAFLAFTGLTSCGGGKNPVEELKLTKDFSNKTFKEDGIQEVTLDRVSDGDTATFDGIDVRFEGVNTPESTGQIEKWGKDASNFTKGKLNDAKSIVIEGDNGVGHTPSSGTGKRLMGYVWYMPSNSERYYNLNLELVYNGYTDNTLEESEEYFKYFDKAYKYASSKNLKIHSQEDDPLFDETLEVMDLRTITADPQKYDQNLVQVEAYVISAPSNQEIIIGQVVDGKEYTFSIYLGYETFEPEIIRVGNYVKFIARVNSHYDKWQLSGLTYDLLDTNTTRVITHGYRCTFGEAVSLAYNYEAILVKEVTTDGEYTIVKGKTKNYKQNDVTATIKVRTSDVKSIVVGSLFKCVAYNTANVSFKTDAKEISLEVISASDILK